MTHKKFKASTLFFATAVSISSCAKEPPQKNKSEMSSADIELKVQTLLENERNTKIDLEKNLQNSPLELQRQRDINASLCQRLQSYRLKCPVTWPTAGKIGVLACANNIDTNLDIQPEYKAAIAFSGIQGNDRFKITTNSAWETEDFTASTAGSTLKWKLKSGITSNQLAPKIYSFRTIRLERTSKENLPDQVSTFKLTAAIPGQTGKLLADGLLPGQQSYVRDIDISQMSKLRETKDCKISYDEIVALETEASKRADGSRVEKVSSDETKNTTQASATGTSNDADACSGSGSLKAFCLLRIENAKIKASLAPIKRDLESELDRTGLLKQELSQDLGTGCWAQKPIESFKIKIAGAGPSTKPISDAIQEKGVAGSFTYDFGVNNGDLSFSTNEMTSPLITKTGQSMEVVSRLPNSKTVGDIQQIKITKNYRAQEKSDRTVSSGGFTGFFGETTQVTKYFEALVFAINSIEIIVNDQTVYRNSNVGYEFKGDNDTWVARDLLNSTEYRQLMSRNDCSN